MAMAFGSKNKAGVIGLGIIGSRVAASLRRAGYRTFVWNRSPRPEPNFLGSPAEVADAARYVQLFVSDEKALFECIEAMAPALTRDHIVLNHASISPEHTLRAAEMVWASGAKFLDAPFTGSRNSAAEARLVYYVGGDKDVLEKLRPQLEVSGRKVMHLGPVGAASAVKIATNMINAVSTQVLSEALALTVGCGVPAEDFAAAVAENGCRSGVIDMKLAKMMAGDYEPHFSLKHMFKDVQFALQMAQKQNLELPTTSTVAAILLAGLHQGRADMDFSAVALNFGFVPREPEPEVEPAGDSEPAEALDEETKGPDSIASDAAPVVANALQIGGPAPSPDQASLGGAASSPDLVSTRSGQESDPPTHLDRAEMHPLSLDVADSEKKPLPVLSVADLAMDEDDEEK